MLITVMNSNLLSPVMSLMKTCIVDSGSTDEEREETGERDDKEEILLERMVVVVRRVTVVVNVKSGASVDLEESRSDDVA